VLLQIIKIFCKISLMLYNYKSNNFDLAGDGAGVDGEGEGEVDVCVPVSANGTLSLIV
jgi:hypothetical protein